MIKRLLSLLLLPLLPMAALSQGNIAVVDVAVSSDEFNRAPMGIFTAVEVTIKNVDSLVLPVGDSALFSYQVGTEIHDAWVHFTANIDTGATFTYNFGSSERFHFSATMDSIVLIGMVTHLNDNDLSDNQYQETFFSSASVNNDWHGAGITIISPSNLNFFDVDNGTNVPPPLSEVEVDLVNDGEVTYLAGTRIDYSLYIDADVRTIQGSISGGAVAPGETSTRTISNQAVLPAIPDSIGVFQLCAKPMVPSDLNPGNDASCMIFNIIDNYDPSDPNNWPFSVEAVDEKQANLYVVDNVLNIECIGNYSLELFDLSGKSIRTQELQGNQRLVLQNLNAGIYFVRLQCGDQSPISKKVVIH